MGWNLHPRCFVRLVAPEVLVCIDDDTHVLPSLFILRAPGGVDEDSDPQVPTLNTALTTQPALRARGRNSLRPLTPAWARLFLGASVASPLAVAQSATAHEGYAQLPGVRIWYKDTGGSGVPVILMHAATGSSRVGEPQIRALTAAGYRVIAYDRRGWGRSVTETGAMPGTAADVLQALMGFLRSRRVPPL